MALVVQEEKHDKVQIWYGTNDKCIQIPLIDFIPDSDIERNNLFTDPLPGAEKCVKIIVDGKHECVIGLKRKIFITVLQPIPESLPPLYHFYHLWVAGNPEVWPRIVNEHIDALICSGFLTCIKCVYLGLVGPLDQMEKALAIFANRSIPVVVIALSHDGFEQVTIKKIIPNVKETNACVLYCHNKGCLDISQHRDWWRQSMTAHTVYEWRKCVQLLTKENFDVAGIHWIVRSPHRLFGGNFWWATSAYLQTLKPVKTATRFDAENWIGENPAVKAADLKPGWPHYPTADN